MMKPNKVRHRRAPNFSKTEMARLLALVEKYRPRIGVKNLDQLSRKEKRKAWAELTVEFNDGTTSYHRTAENLKSCYRNHLIDSKLSKEFSDMRSKILGAGMSPKEEKIDTVKTLTESHEEASLCTDDDENVDIKIDWETIFLKGFEKPQPKRKRGCSENNNTKMTITKMNNNHMKNAHMNDIHMNNADDVNAAHMNAAHMNAAHTNAAHMNADHMNTAYMNAAHTNAAHTNAAHMNAGHMNADHMNATPMNTAHKIAAHVNNSHMNNTNEEKVTKADTQNNWSREVVTQPNVREKIPEHADKNDSAHTFEYLIERKKELIEIRKQIHLIDLAEKQLQSRHNAKIRQVEIAIKEMELELLRVKVEREIKRQEE